VAGGAERYGWGLLGSVLLWAVGALRGWL